MIAAFYSLHFSTGYKNQEVYMFVFTSLRSRRSTVAR